MPHFFFDTHSDLASLRDVEGVELASPENARQELIKALPGILRDELSMDDGRRDIKTDIRDDAGRVIFTARVSLITAWID